MQSKRYVVQITEEMLRSSLKARGLTDKQIAREVLQAARKQLMANIDPPRRSGKNRHLLHGEYD